MLIHKKVDDTLITWCFSLSGGSLAVYHQYVVSCAGTATCMIKEQPRLQ